MDSYRMQPSTQGSSLGRFVEEKKSLVHARKETAIFRCPAALLQSLLRLGYTRSVSGSILVQVHMLLVQSYSSASPSAESNTYFRTTIEVH
jgi:hypothetical protein